MAEATANSKEKSEIKVSTIILPENKNYESESLKYEINIPNWLLEIIENYEVSQLLHMHLTYLHFHRR